MSYLMMSRVKRKVEVFDQKDPSHFLCIYKMSKAKKNKTFLTKDV